MTVHSDFEKRFVSRLSGICFIGDPNDFDGWSPSDNGTGNTGGGGHQGNGGDGNWRDNLPGKPGSGYYGRPPGTPPSVGGNDGTGSRTPNSSGAFEDELFEEDRKNHRGSPEALRKEFNDYIKDRALDLVGMEMGFRQDNFNAFADSIATGGHMERNDIAQMSERLSWALETMMSRGVYNYLKDRREAEYEKIYGSQRMDDAIEKILGYKPPPTTPYIPPPTPAPAPSSSASYPMSVPSPTLPSHPNYRTTGYAIDGYDRIFMYGDHTHYTISKLAKVTGYKPPAGKELVKWYGTTYAIPDAAARRRQFG